MHVVVAPDKFKGIADRGRGGRPGERRDRRGRRRGSPVARGAGGRRRRRHRRRRHGRRVTRGSRCAPRAGRRTGGHRVRAAGRRRGGRDGRRVRAAAAAREGLPRCTASSYGTGQVDRRRPGSGLPHVLLLGIGGSASTDGGAGLLSALGARLLDADGASSRGGPRWPSWPRLELAGLHPAWPAPRSSWPATSTIRCPARTARPPCTARRRAPTRTTSRLLDAALARWADVVDAATGTGLRDPGAGRAGGVGYAALAALGAELGRAST